MVNFEYVVPTQVVFGKDTQLREQRQALPHAHARSGLACAAVVAQRAHELASLAARAPGAIGHDELGRRHVDGHLAARDGVDASVVAPPILPLANAGQSAS